MLATRKLAISKSSTRVIACTSAMAASTVGVIGKLAAASIQAVITEQVANTQVIIAALVIVDRQVKNMIVEAMNMMQAEMFLALLRMLEMVRMVQLSAKVIIGRRLEEVADKLAKVAMRMMQFIRYMLLSALAAIAEVVDCMDLADKTSY